MYPFDFYFLSFFFNRLNGKKDAQNDGHCKLYLVIYRWLYFICLVFWRLELPKPCLSDNRCKANLQPYLVRSFS
jgi:hypothetical protein